METLSEDQIEIFNSYKNGENIFITGPGGCGKSYLLKCIINDLKINNINFAVTALTGCAAILLGSGSQTINRWASIGLAKGNDDMIISSISLNKYKKANWIKTQVLIIDEISMMSKHMFELLDSIGKYIRKNAKPFGGIQLIMSGDFYQLPPVGNKGNPDSFKFCFESNLWDETFDSQYILDKSFRQKDETYLNILNEIRDGKLSLSSYNLLKTRVNISYDKELITKPVSLNPTKTITDKINKEQMDKLDTETITYPFYGTTTLTIPKGNTKKTTLNQTSITNYFDNKKTTDISSNTIDKENDLFEFIDNIKELEDTKKLYEINKNLPKDIQIPKSNDIINAIDYLDKNSHFSKELTLKVGAQVMCTKNIDMDLGIYNGSVGIIQKLYPKAVDILFNNGINYHMKFAKWYHDNIENVTFYQIPIILAWAITIHKSQGATLEHAEIDIGSSIFAEGQTYVALSRVKSIQGLYLKSFNPQKIKTNKKVIEFYNRFYEEETDDEDC